MAFVLSANRHVGLDTVEGKYLMYYKCLAAGKFGPAANLADHLCFAKL